MSHISGRLRAGLLSLAHSYKGQGFGGGGKEGGEVNTFSALLLSARSTVKWQRVILFNCILYVCGPANC